ncbi:hypothetical protein DFH09DRAFT_1105462 [Mycena vulgaris]|nr:hypothetical protein DFH09DRAFT_1105462 [Mycena vulgaris]
MLYSMVLLSFTIFGLTSASPLSAATCLPSAASNVSLSVPNFTTTDGSFPSGPRELGVSDPNSPFGSIFWGIPAQVGRWNLVKSGIQVPGKLLTSVQGAGDVELADGPPEAQKWEIACATCPSNGLATDCTFENFRFPNVPGTDICILTQGIPELGNDALVGDCKTGVDGAVGTSIQINYDL